MSNRLVTVVLLALLLASGSTSDAEPDQPTGNSDRPLGSGLESGPS